MGYLDHPVNWRFFYPLVKRVEALEESHAALIEALTALRGITSSTDEGQRVAHHNAKAATEKALRLMKDGDR
jgi:hypothetical protein